VSQGLAIGEAGVRALQVAGIRDALLAGKDWESIAETQKRVLADTNLASSRQLQALLEAFESLASREEDEEARMVRLSAHPAPRCLPAVHAGLTSI
jgi:hypothetical protein